MAISFPRSIPDVGYVASDLILRDTVTASPSGGGLINYTQVAAPAWEVSLETRPLDYDEYSAVEAWWLSLRGGLRSVLFRQPHNGYPMAHRMDQAPARTPGRLASVSSGNALSIISVDPALILSAGDRIGLEHANRWYVGRVTEASGSGTTRVISVEPPPPSNIAQPGAVIRFDRPGLLMRPVPDSYQATRSGRHYSVSFRLVEVAGVGSVPRDMDFNFTSPLVAAPYFTRASSATYYGADGLLKTAAINEPRIDHDPVTREPLGLLIEELRTNLLTYSEDFSNSVWQKVRTTVSINTAISPSGSVTGDTLREGNSESLDFVQQTALCSTAATFSVYLKAAGRTEARLQLANAASAGNRIRGHFDLAAGTVVVFNDGSATGAVGTIKSVGFGWYRCSISGLADTVFSSLSCAILIGFLSHQGDGASGFYAWGAQLEAGATATSYIPATAAVATRAADVASIPVQDFLNEAEGSIVAEFNRENLIGGYLLSISRNPPPAGQWGPRHQASFVNLLSRVDYQVAADDNVGSGIIDTPVALGKNKVALRYSGAEYSAASNGAPPRVRQTAANPPTGLGLLRLGQNATGGVSLNGHIKRVTYFPRRLSDAELQEITA